MKIVAIVLGVFVLLAGALGFSIWRASLETVTSMPGPLEAGRAKLQAQLADAQKVELQAEKQNWNSAPRLRALEKGHEQRIDQLKGNSQAGEILEYDRTAIERLKNRIAELDSQAVAQPAAAATEPGKESDQK